MRRPLLYHPLLTALIVGVAFLALGAWLASLAQAHPVSVHRAKVEIRADRLDFPTSPQVDWCARKHYGTICGVSLSECYVDRAFGDSIITTRNLVWVSRTRGVVSVAPLLNVWPPPKAIVHVLYGSTCVPGDVVATP